MKKIAYIINSLETPTAGTEKQLLMVINRLHNVEFDFTLICLRQSEWLKNNQLPCPVHYLSVNSLKSDYFSGCKKLTKLIDENKYDLIHALYFDSLMIATNVITKYPNIALCTSRRGFINSEGKSRLKSFLLRRRSSKIKAYLCNSEAIGQFVIENEKIDPAKIEVIYNGIDFDKIDKADQQNGREILSNHSITDDNIVITTVANLRPVKNIEFLIKTAPNLTKINKNIRFVIVGEGDQREKLEAMISEHNLSENFKLIGSYPNPEEILKASDIGVLPSHSESLSNALIEYSAAQLPAVAADVGGNSEIIEHEKTGYIYPANNEEKYIELMSRLIKDSNLRERLGKTGYQQVNGKFSIDANLSAHKRFYQKLIEGKTDA